MLPGWLRVAQPIVALVGVLALATVAVTLATDSAQVVTDLFYSITGFCAGFLYATFLYEAHDVRRRRGRGRRG